MVEKNTKRRVDYKVQDLKDILGLIISISSVLGIFTGIVNKLFNNKLKPVYKRFEDTDKRELQRHMDNCRYRVVSFASELHNGAKKTRYEFQIISQFANQYEECVKELGLVNHIFNSEVEFIEKCYKELDDEK